VIRRYISCVATLAVDALIWAMSLTSSAQDPETDEQRRARYAREDAIARVRWIDEHRKGNDGNAR
jgi:hypothetical protein